MKLSLDWAVHRQIWRGQAVYIRSLFEANKDVRDPRQQQVRLRKSFSHGKPLTQPLQVLLRETEKLLETWKHPDPYRAPTAPGGNKWERNLPARILPCMCQSFRVTIYSNWSFRRPTPWCSLNQFSFKTRCTLPINLTIQMLSRYTSKCSIYCRMRERYIRMYTFLTPLAWNPRSTTEVREKKVNV